MDILNGCSIYRVEGWRCEAVLTFNHTGSYSTKSGDRRTRSLAKKSDTQYQAIRTAQNGTKTIFTVDTCVRYYYYFYEGAQE